MSLFFPGPESPANAPRFAPGGLRHVESYFLRANDPTRARALWVKATVLQPLSGPAVAETWFIFFDGEKQRTFAHKQTVPLATAAFTPGRDRLDITIATTSFALADAGRLQGELTSPRGTAAWELDFVTTEGPVAQPLVIYPWRLLREGPFPRSKLLTPYPSLRFDGRVKVFGETVDIAGWTGMQGHNWGKEHAFEYVWGQCLFPATAAGPQAMVEGFSGRVKVGSVTTPRLSALVVRRGAQSYRFDRIFDTWRQEASLAGWRWTVRLRGEDGEASLTMDGSGRPMACLGYLNPDGQLSYCFNTKLAQVWLHVQPKGAPGFQLESQHGGALEFLRRQPDPSIPDVV